MESCFSSRTLLMLRLIDTRTAHGVNSYSYTVAPNERISIAYIYLTPENTVTLTGGSMHHPTHAFCIGISNGNVSKTDPATTGKRLFTYFLCSFQWNL